ncbi:hypothetical protein ACWXV6_19530 [Pantoea ananatis]|uniref:hypothetical protein n=1 Tax=Pantoea ananas TaxID=553 RepID=UPI0021AF78A4|nr:hypothetical protein [Pantoea ananatis]
MQNRQKTLNCINVFALSLNKRKGKFMNSLNSLTEHLNELMRSTEFDNRDGRADLLEHCVEKIYNFVKFERPGGQGLDGRSGPELEEMSKVVDVIKKYKFNEEI